jgi:hypothetical protein
MYKREERRLKEFANNIPQKLADYGNNYEDPVQSGIKYKHSSTYSLAPFTIEGTSKANVGSVIEFKNV